MSEYPVWILRLASQRGRSDSQDSPERGGKVGPVGRMASLFFAPVESLLAYEKHRHGTALAPSLSLAALPVATAPFPRQSSSSSVSRPSRWLMRGARKAARVLLRLFYRITVTGREHLDQAGSACSWSPTTRP